MKISLITVTYNSGKTVRDTLESVLRQTYFDTEYIIVDGASTDNTMDLIRQYAPRFNRRIRYVSEPDRGLYDAMNKGIRMATGEVVGILNSDDLFAEATALEKIINCFLRHPETDAVYADLYYVASQDTDRVIRHWISGKRSSFRKGWHPAHPTFYVRREVYQRYGLFDPDFKLAADFELMLRFIEKNNIRLVYLPEPLVRMRLGGATSKNLTNIIRGNKECIEAFKKHGLKAGCLYPFFRLLPKIKQYFQ